MKLSSTPSTRRPDFPPTVGFSPRVVGQWLLIHKVAESRWTTLFQAKAATSPPEAPPRYAVKMLRDECSGSEMAARLLRREVEVAQTVTHPHIVPILAWQLRKTPYYIVMPWLEGFSLRYIIDHFSPLPTANALWVTRQIAEALVALHGGGWIHGDLKPENIILAKDHHVTLIDLGLCVRQSEINQRRRIIAGTFNYMAPEWWTRGGRPDHRSDLFSLGLILYEMLCGKCLYRANTLEELVSVHRSWCLPPLRSLRPTLPYEVVRLLRSLLARLPERRPASARAVVEELCRLEIEFLADRET